MPEFIKPRIFSSMINIWINDDYLKKICNSSDPRWNKMDLSTALLLTLNHTAIPHLLRWEDKNSMRWSIETRPPFLDINLVEHSMGIQSDQKLKDGKTKYIYRKEMKDIIPSMITGRKDKMGFETTVNDLFRDPKIIAFFQEIINSETFKNRPYWDHAQVKQLFNKHVEGKIHIGDTIWKWINLELWLRIYFNHS
jgi:asparagine synthase (glutamine-hydrolysing)